MADPTAAEVLGRCEKLVDGPVARAAERRLPEATLAEVRDADLFRMVVSRSLGGMGHGLGTLAQSTRILAAGCPASAWTLSFLIMHSWLVGRFDEAAPVELGFEPRPTDLL